MACSKDPKLCKWYCVVCNTTFKRVPMRLGATLAALKVAQEAVRDGTYDPVAGKLVVR